MVTLNWTSDPDPDEKQQALRLLDAAQSADGVEPASEPVLLRLRHGLPGEHLLARDDPGVLVGYAALGGRTAELAVHPEHRREGTGTRLVATLAGHAGRPLWVWAHGRHPAALRLADRFGFERARELWQLRRSLAEPLPARALPDGLRLRGFVPGRDEDAVVAVNNRAFASHPEQAGWETSELVLREDEPWFDPAGFLLAVDGDDRLAGFHWTKIHPDGAGEVYVLGIDPSAQGTGLGAALTVAGLEYLAGRGCAEVLLYTEADNEAAVRMYDKLGFAHHRTDVALHIG